MMSQSKPQSFVDSLHICGIFLILFGLSLGSKVDGQEAYTPLFYPTAIIAGAYIIYGSLKILIIFGNTKPYFHFMFVCGSMIATGLLLVIMANFDSLDTRNLKDIAYFFLFSFAFITLWSEKKDLTISTLVNFSSLLVLSSYALHYFEDFFGCPSLLAEYCQKPWMSGDIHGFFKTSMHLSFYTATLCMFHLSEKNYRNFCFFFLLLLCSGARMSILAVFLALICFFISMKYRKRTIMLALCPIVVLGPLIALGLKYLYPDLIKLIFSENFVDPKSRFNIWSSVELHISFFGDGFRQSTALFNQYLTFFAEFGLIGFVLLLISFVLIAFRDNQSEFEFLLFIFVLTIFAFQSPLLSSAPAVVSFFYLSLLFNYSDSRPSQRNQLK